MGFESLHRSQTDALDIPGSEEAAGFRRLLDSLVRLPAAPNAVAPAAVHVCGVTLAGARRVVALPGSFNPPHAAHLALLHAGVVAAGADAGAYLLSARTVDKEQVTGMRLEDRLALMCRLVAATECMVVTVAGLYVDIAAALRSTWATIDDLAFVVGHDKIVQVFDPRYYEDRDAALNRLFAAARFYVAPRDASTTLDVAALLARSENRRYAPRVETLQIDPALARVSSTAARERRGDDPALPDVVRHFIAVSGCYWDEARYGLRAAP